MVTLVNSSEKRKSFLESFDDEWESKPILIPIWNDEEEHPKETSLSLLAISFSSEKTFCLPFDHNESKCVINNLSFLEGESYFVQNKKDFLQNIDLEDIDLIDLDLLSWFNENKKLNIQKLPTYFRTFPKFGHRVKTKHIPLYQICDQLEKIIDEIHSLVDSIGEIQTLESFQKYNNTVIPAFSHIESNGLKIQEDCFHKTFKDKIDRTFEDGVYTDYDLYTSTGRPSNSAYNINFAALDPSENQKDPFVSRFNDGVLVQFDYDAFHLRLIGNLISYDLPEESFHTYLGKKYFDKESLTAEEYEDSKKITFQFLYGKDIEEARNVEYFDRTFDFRDELWDAFKEEGFLLTPEFKRKIPKKNIPEVNPGKAFSYLIQSYETEFNSKIMKDLLSLLEDFKTELVLYTYDAFLFDFCLKDGKELIRKIKTEMETQNMKVKGSIGRNFGEMRSLGF